MINVKLVDAFTKISGFGNRAGVVLSADGLNDNQMQTVARLVNVSETAFVLSPQDNSHDIWVRYFTPTVEVPICGHATIATHYARAVALNLPTCTVRVKTGAGILPVDIIAEENDYKIVMTQGDIVFGRILSLQQQQKLILALGITEADLINNLPIQIVSTGHSKVMIPLKSRNKLNSLQPKLQLLKDLSVEIGCNGYFSFTFDSNNPEILTFGRMFAPAIGINEDPVTGNANGPLGAYLVKYNIIKPVNYLARFKACQGEAINKTGLIEVSVWTDGLKANKVQVAGQAVIAKEINFTGQQINI